jgi:hypothetical protein
LVLLLALGCTAASAYGDTTSGSGGGFSGSGTLVTTDNGDGSYTIVDIMGSGFTGLLAPGSFDNNDNQLFPSAPSVVDAQGFAFGYTMGDTDFNVDISSSGGGYTAYLVDSDLFSETIPVTISVTDPPAPVGYQYWSLDIGTPAAAPEPSGLVLLATGLAGACRMVRRRMS